MGLSTSEILKHQKKNNGVALQGKLLENLKEILLEILNDFDYVCGKYHLYYSLCGGSALGAVRHHGFIPWDDDIDVFMTRDSYEKFLTIFEKELGNKYTLHSPETTPELGMPLAQLSLNGTIYRTHLAPERENPGVFLDIFILENVPNSIILRGIQGFFSLAFGLCLSCSRFAKDKHIILGFLKNADKKTLKSLKEKIFIGTFLNFFVNSRNWSIWTNQINSLCKNKMSQYVSCPSGRKHYFKEMYQREYMCNVRKVPFENLMLNLMLNPEYYLVKLYGDTYMTPPSEADREVHCILECNLERKS